MSDRLSARMRSWMGNPGQVIGFVAGARTNAAGHYDLDLDLDASA